MVLPPQQRQDISNRARSAYVHPAVLVAPDEIRRCKSEPLTARPGAAEQRFTDRLLKLLTNTAATSGIRCSAVPAVSFGADPPLRPEAGPKPGKCVVCMEDVQESMLLCLNVECSSRFCKTCIAGFATEAVDRALYAVPWLHCPGCRGRVSTAAWGGYAPEALEKYKSNAEAMLTFRCSECHEPSTLYQECSAGAEVIDCFEEAEQLKEAWRAFAFAESSPDSLLSLLPNTQEASKMLPGIVDLERRTCLHLAILRRNPFILTPCCDAEFCFKCKVGSHHEGETCEERQRAELDIHVQFCPECEVPTVRTEGCDHIVCVCGADWTWQKYRQVGFALGPVGYLRELLGSGELDPNWTETNSPEDRSGRGKSLLMFTAGGGRLENTMVLIEAGADVNIRDHNNCSALLCALGAGESGEFHGSCVELLIEHGAELSCEDPFVWMHHSSNLQGFKKLMELCHKNNQFAVDHKHNNQSLLQVALQKGRAQLAKELIDNQHAQIERWAPFWFLQGNLSDTSFFDSIFESSGLGVNDFNSTEDSNAKTLVQLAILKNKKDMVRHLILKHKASPKFIDVVKPYGYWQSHVPIPKDLFDALVQQGANVWEQIPTPQTSAPDEQKGWLLSQVVACLSSHASLMGRRSSASPDDLEYLLGRLLSLWDKEADAFAKTAAGSALVVQVVALSLSASSTSSSPSAAVDASKDQTPQSVKASPWILAKRLIEAGAECESKDAQGRTPLCLVVSSAAKSIEQLEVLLKAGANVLSVNRKGQTALQVATSNSWSEGAELLRFAETKQRAAAEEAARKAARSGDGTLHNVGLRVEAMVHCSQCNQRFDSEEIRQVHWRFQHDTSRRQED